VTAFVPFCLRVYNSVHTFIAWWIPVLDDAASILSDYVCVCVCVCVCVIESQKVSVERKSGISPLSMD